jgi:uncharacterized RDD family membrane protein YckC
VRKVGLALAALSLAGCAGYLRPYPVGDGGRLLLLMGGKRLNSPDPETMVFVRAAGGSGEWKRLRGWSGAARSAALWKGSLWVLFRGNCSSYDFSEGDPVRTGTHGFGPGPRPSALVVHEGALWALGAEGRKLVLFSKSKPREEWRPLASTLDLGRAAAQFRAAATADAIWVLWRKRKSDGELLPETFSAYFRDGMWHLGPARALGGRELAACPDPAGRGLLVAAVRPGEGPLGSGRRLVLFRVGPGGWSRPQDVNVSPRQFGSAVLGLGLIASPSDSAPGGRELLLFVGRRGGVGVYRAELAGPGLPTTWRESETVELDVYGPEVVLGFLLLLAALAVGTGLGIAAVRRKRVFPLMPGQPQPAPFLARAGAWVMDNLLITLIFYATLLITGLPVNAALRHSGLVLLLVGANRLLFCFYSVVFEARWAATPGKLAFGLRVAMTDGHRPTARAAIVRNAFRLVDEALVFPLPGLIMAIVSRHAQRIGDVFAKTVVSTARSVSEIAEDRRRKSDRFGLP